MSDHQRGLRVVRLSGIYDAIVLLPLAIPPIAERIITALVGLNDHAGLGGTLDLGTHGILFLALMAILSVVFGVFRALFPIFEVGICDVAARLLLGACLASYLITSDAAQVLWVFVAAEGIWAVFQAVPLRRAMLMQGVAHCR